jgi:hypothetical protein
MTVPDEKPVQLDLFSSLTEPKGPPPAPVLNGMYYEKATDKFVSFMLGKRHYEEPALGCKHPKEWQNRIKRERAI